LHYSRSVGPAWAEHGPVALRRLGAHQVFFEDGYAVEGASQLRVVISRLVFKALRDWDPAIFDERPLGRSNSQRLRLQAAQPQGEGRGGLVAVEVMDTSSNSFPSASIAAAIAASSDVDVSKEKEPSGIPHDCEISDKS
jgi:hypothetical protein